jgi:hypothetical protein
MQRQVRNGARAVRFCSVLTLTVPAILGIDGARAEQPPPPCHPNPTAASDEAALRSRGDIVNLPGPLQDRPHTRGQTGFTRFTNCLSRADFRIISVKLPTPSRMARSVRCSRLFQALDQAVNKTNRRQSVTTRTCRAIRTNLTRTTVSTPSANSASVASRAASPTKSFSMSMKGRLRSSHKSGIFSSACSMLMPPKSDA